MPERFLAIGEWYEDFAQTSDEEVVALLRAARAVGSTAGTGAAAGPGTAGGAGGGAPAWTRALAEAAAGVVPVDAAGQADDGQEEQVRERQADGTQEQEPGQDGATGTGQAAHGRRRRRRRAEGRPGRGLRRERAAAASLTAWWP